MNVSVSLRFEKSIRIVEKEVLIKEGGLFCKFECECIFMFLVSTKVGMLRFGLYKFHYLKFFGTNTILQEYGCSQELRRLTPMLIAKLQRCRS